eukprot:4492776-Amphidinium_carterae.2
MWSALGILLKDQLFQTLHASDVAELVRTTGIRNGCTVVDKLLQFTRTVGISDGETIMRVLWKYTCHDVRRDCLASHAFVQELLQQYVSRRGGRGRETTSETQIDKKDIHIPNLKELQGVFGSLLWAAMRTRPDICHVHSLASAALVHSESATRCRVKHILQYLSTHPEFGFHFPFHDVDSAEVYQVICYADATYRGTFSQSGRAVFWGTEKSKCVLGWASNRQTLLAE